MENKNNNSNFLIVCPSYFFTKIKGWMRGFFLADDIDYSRAMNSKKHKRGPRVFLESLILGRNFQVYTHIIVPTSCSMYLDDTREDVLKTIWKHKKCTKLQLKALRHQNQIMHMCAICDCILEKNPGRPYQMALRLVGGQKEGVSPWNYDMLMAVLCRKCQTRPTEMLLLVSELNYLELADFIAKYGFEQTIEMDTFLDEAQGDIVKAIASMYLWRIDCVNQHSAEIYRTLSFELGCCYHCGDSTSSPLDVCKECGLIGYCRGRSPIYPTLTCKTFGWAVEQHAQQLCVEIRKSHLFHTEAAHYILKEFQPS